MIELLLKEMKAMQEKGEADRKAAQEDLLVKMKADRKAAQENLLVKMEADRKAAQENLLAKRDANQAKADADRVQLQEMMKTMHANQTKADAKIEGPSERLDKTEMALQTAEMCHDATTKRLKEDLTKTYNECKRIEETKREFQARWDKTRQTRAEGANTPGAGTCSAQPPTFDGNTTWSVFRRQFDVVAEHNQWSDWDKSTYLITALKGRAADVLPGIPTNTTYEDTLRALEDRFGDQHFAAAYRCQLTTWIQNTGESLQDFATAVETIARRAYPNLPTDYVARKTGNSASA
jgi:hypothetical protein